QSGSRPRKMTVSTPTPTCPTSWLLRKTASTTAKAVARASRSAPSSIRRTSQPRRIRRVALSGSEIGEGSSSAAERIARPAASGAPAVDVALNANPSPLSPELTIAYPDDGGLATVMRAGFNVSRTRPRAAGATKVPSPSSWNYGNTLGHDPQGRKYRKVGDLADHPVRPSPSLSWTAPPQ